MRTRGAGAFATAILLPLLAVLALAGCGSSDSSSSSDSGSSTSGESGGGDPVSVGIMEIAPAEVIEETVTAFEASMQKELAPREVTFDVKNAQEETSLIQSIGREFAESGDDLFAVIGTPAVIAFAKEETERPIIALAMGDPVGSKVAESLEHPGGNVTGSIDYIDPRLILEQVEQVAPAAKTIGTVYDPSNENSVVWVEAMKKAVAASPGMSLKEATIGSSADITAAARSVAEGSEAMIIGPDAKVIAGLPAVISATGADEEPLYVVGGDPTVEGVFATLGPNYATLGARTGVQAAEIAAGKAKPETTAFLQPGNAEWGINPKTMEELGLEVPAAILKQAGVK
jgi:putative tryptophan/tyrosine transport system substrate-binding protein